ncbi:nucleotidyltransferase family protein [Nocardioides sp. STR2]|uniref:Nucleotidyltransferase family protein n=1 Tax=Nocardioides pini TaxID=2975053 RepID=A0ABT4CCA8_9ACTN|nr:nucleotidyltransferase family protein [Nocardioides pini]
MLAADLSVALTALRDAAVRALAFKGVALSAQAYEDFALRGAGDLDVLVDPKDLERAHRVLASAGWAPAPGYPMPGPSWAWRHLVRTGNELLLNGSSTDIDLHWHLVPTRGTFPDFDTLWGRHQDVHVDGHPTPTLSGYDALAHSAGHAAKDRWRWMRSLLDVHVLAARRNTWLSADRRLRADELLSVGLAVRMFGRTSTMPSIADKAADAVGPELWRHVCRDQVMTAPAHQPFAVPGINFLLGLRGAARTGASPIEGARLLSRSALPPWVTAEFTSTNAISTVSSALAKRVGDVIVRLRRSEGS